MTSEHAVMIRRMEVVDYAASGEDCARAIATQLKKRNVVEIRSHRFFSMGRNLHEATSRLDALEETAKIHLAGRFVGGTPGLGENEVKKTGEAYSRE